MPGMHGHLGRIAGDGDRDSDQCAVRRISRQKPPRGPVLDRLDDVARHGRHAVRGRHGGEQRAHRLHLLIVHGTAPVAQPIRGGREPVGSGRRAHPVVIDVGDSPRAIARDGGTIL